MSRYGMLQCSKTSMRAAGFRLREGMKLIVEQAEELKKAAIMAEKLKDLMEVKVARVSRTVAKFSGSEIWYSVTDGCSVGEEFSLDSVLTSMGIIWLGQIFRSIGNILSTIIEHNSM